MSHPLITGLAAVWVDIELMRLHRFNGGGRRGNGRSGSQSFGREGIIVVIQRLDRVPTTVRESKAR